MSKAITASIEAILAEELAPRRAKHLAAAIISLLDKEKAPPPAPPTLAEAFDVISAALSIPRMKASTPGRKRGRPPAAKAAAVDDATTRKAARNERDRARRAARAAETGAPAPKRGRPKKTEAVKVKLAVKRGRRKIGEKLRKSNSESKLVYWAVDRQVRSAPPEPNDAAVLARANPEMIERYTETIRKRRGIRKRNPQVANKPAVVATLPVAPNAPAPVVAPPPPVAATPALSPAVLAELVAETPPVLSEVQRKVLDL